MHRILLPILVAAVGFAQVAEAQVCAGFPSSERGFYFGARADFPEGQNTSLGVEAAYNAAGPLSVFGGLNVLSHDLGEETDVENQLRLGAAFELASLGGTIGPRVSACPVAEVGWRDREAGRSLIDIPIGLGVGADLGMPAGPSISGYVQPQLVTLLSVGGVLPNTSTTEFGITGGAMVGFGQITVGGEFRHVFMDDADPTFGIRVGLRL